MDEPRHIRVDLGSLREKAGNQQRRGRLLYSTHEWMRDVHEFDEVGDLRLYLQPGEVKVIKF